MKAVIYTRFSDRIDAEECKSSANQLERGRKWCDLHQHEIIGTFDDSAISGKSMDNRPGFQAAMEMVCEHRAMLVVTDLDRLSRTTKDALAIIDKIKKAGAHLSIINLQIDTSTPVGEFFFTIMAAFAQLQRKQISQKTKNAMLAHQAAGRRMSFRTPYGWQPDPNNPALLVMDYDEQDVIKWIVDEHKRGKKLRVICRLLMDEGIYCRGGSWHHQTIKRILKRSEPAKAAGPEGAITH